MAFDISLTAAMRSNLVSLQQTTELLGRTQERLSTGKKVNSALDNPSAFFAAQAHNDRAAQLDGRKEAIGEAIQTIKAANNGVSAVTKLLEAARGIVSQARAASVGAQMTTLSTQFDAIMSQITNTITDSGYKGVNLLENDSLAVAFNEDNTTSLNVTGFSMAPGGSTITVAATGEMGSITDVNKTNTLNALEDKINVSLSNMRTESAGLASNLTILQVRNDFLTSTVNTLVEGANKLTLADTNEEGANLLMLQTRQQLGTTSLSLASQAAQSVLRLF